jgi:hypothetical protein
MMAVPKMTPYIHDRIRFFTTTMANRPAISMEDPSTVNIIPNAHPAGMGGIE